MASDLQFVEHSVSTFHPSYIGRDKRKFEGCVLKVDMDRLLKLARREWRPKWDRSKYITGPSLKTALKVLKGMAKKGRRVSFDIETDGGHAYKCTVRCIAFHDGHTTICIPFVYRDGTWTEKKWTWDEDDGEHARCSNPNCKHGANGKRVEGNVAYWFGWRDGGKYRQPQCYMCRTGKWPAEAKRGWEKKMNWLPWWTPDQEDKVYEAMQSVFDVCRLETQNGQYDRLCLELRTSTARATQEVVRKKYPPRPLARPFVIPSANKPGNFDTILGHHIVASYFPHNLNFLAGIYTEVPYYKTTDEGDAWSASSDYELWEYACLYGTTKVMLASGKTANISDLVRSKSREKVLGADKSGNIVETPILSHHESCVSGQQWVEIRHQHGRGILRCTPDHFVFTQRGRVRAAHLKTTDCLILSEKVFTVEQEGAILGTVLGDSTLALSPDSRTAGEGFTASLTGGNVLKGLVEWKAKLLPLTFYKVHRARPHRDIYQYRSRGLRQLALLRPELYDQDGTRRIKECVLDRLGSAGWAMWFADDGAFQKSYPKRDRTSRLPDARTQEVVCLNVHRYPKADRNLLCRWLMREFGGHVGVYGRGQLRMSRLTSEKFCHYIARKVPLEARYKLLPEYRNFPLDEVVVAQHGLSSPIYSIGKADLDRTDRRTRRLADTRWCLTTGTGNFFTLNGLVKNCDDVVCQYTAATKLREEVTERPEDIALYDHDSWYEEQAQQWKRVGFRIDWRAVELFRMEYGDKQERALKSMRELLEKELLKAEKDNKKKHEQLTELLDVLSEKFSGSKGTFKKDHDESEYDDVAADEAAGIFNPASLAQLRLLLRHLGVPLTQQTATGDLSTKKDFLLVARKELVARGEKGSALAFLDFLFAWRECAKMKSTYLYPDLICHGEDDYRTHGTFNIHVVPTGRLSGSGPNLTNQPMEIRGMFIAFIGHKLVTGDWSALEMRLNGLVTGDSAMIEMFKEFDAGKGLKPHIVNASRIFELPLTADLEKKYPGCYRAAKVFAYLLGYGGGAKACYEKMLDEMPDMKWDTFLICFERYKKSYPQFFQDQRDIVMKGIQQGYLDEVISGRRIYYWEGARGSEEGSTEAESMQNMRFQGGGATIVGRANRRMVDNVLNPMRAKGSTIEQHVQVHDELLFGVPVKECAAFEPKFKSVCEEQVRTGWNLPVDTHVLEPLVPWAPSRWKPCYVSCKTCGKLATAEYAKKGVLDEVTRWDVTCEKNEKCPEYNKPYRIEVPHGDPEVLQ